MTDNKIIITLDGPSGVGKGTLVTLLGAYYHFITLDTGSLYRAIALYIMTHFDINEVSPEKATEIAQQIADSNEIFTYAKKPEIRLPETSAYVPNISCIPGVRKIVINYQTKFGTNPPNMFDGSRPNGVIVEGRNVGTGVFPNALIKLYIDATPEAKAQRRYKELVAKGVPAVYEDVLADLIQRDKADKERDAAVGKMAVPDDAHYIDTSDLTRGQVFDEAVKFIDEILAKKNAN